MCGARCHFFRRRTHCCFCFPAGWRRRATTLAPPTPLEAKARQKHVQSEKNACALATSSGFSMYTIYTYMVLSDFMWGIKTNHCVHVIGDFCFTIKWFKRLIIMREGEVQRVDLFRASAHGDPASRHISFN
jgi:hypothetical protein